MPINFSISTKFSKPTNLPILIPIKFCHDSWNKIHTYQQNFPHASYKLTTQISHNANALKFKPKIFQQYHKLPTLPNSISHLTLSKLYHNKKHNNSKLLENQHYNMNHHAMPQIPTKWQCPTIKLSMKHETTFFQTKKTKKNSTWCPCENTEHGSWGLEGAPPHHSIQMMKHISCHEK